MNVAAVPAHRSAAELNFAGGWILSEYQTVVWKKVDGISAGEGLWGSQSGRSAGGTLTCIGTPKASPSRLLVAPLSSHYWRHALSSRSATPLPCFAPLLSPFQALGFVVFCDSGCAITFARRAPTAMGK
jgi:hypothetical protein